MEDKGLEPKALENRPDVPEYLLEYLEAFYILSATRTVGFSAENPISIPDINSYLQLNSCENIKLFMFLIGEMDDEYLTLRRPKTAPSSTTTTSPGESMKGNKF